MSFDQLEEIYDDGPGLNVPRKSTKVNLNSKINHSLHNAVLGDSEIRSPTTDQHFQNSIVKPNEGSTQPRMPTQDDNYGGNFEGGQKEDGEVQVIHLNHQIPRPRLI